MDKNKKWKPSLGEIYYIPCFDRTQYSSVTWYNDSTDKMFYNSNLVCKSKTQAIKMTRTFIKLAKNGMYAGKLITVEKHNENLLNDLFKSYKNTTVTELPLTKEVMEKWRGETPNEGENKKVGKYIVYRLISGGYLAELLHKEKENV